MSRVSGVSAKMPRGCYEETDPVELQLNAMSRVVWRMVGVSVQIGFASLLRAGDSRENVAYAKIYFN